MHLNQSHVTYLMQLHFPHDGWSSIQCPFYYSVLSSLHYIFTPIFINAALASFTCMLISSAASG